MSAGSGGLVRAAVQVHDRMDPTWPPVLVALVVAVLIGSVIVVATLFRRFRAAARGGSGGLRR